MMVESDEILPVDRERERKLKYAVCEQQRRKTADYPLLYPRERRLVGGAVLDYNLGFFSGTESESFNYNLTGGMELLGGDLRASVSGCQRDASEYVDLHHLSWRYVTGDNPCLTNIRLGNMFTKGIITSPVFGASISNVPVIPLKVQSSQILDGFTDPGSEIELYINRELIDFTEADDNGCYRFFYNLNYGSDLVSVRIYKPDGEIIAKNSNVNLPYSFLPSGKVYYNLGGGFTGNIPFSGDTHDYIFHGDIACAVNKNLTARVGSDYLGAYKDPSFYTGLSARLFRQYLLDLDFSPESFLRTGARVRYASGAGAKIMYTRYCCNNLYNTGDAREKLYTGFYLPFRFIGMGNGLRTSWERDVNRYSNRTGCSVGFTSRLRRLTARINYYGQAFSDSKRKGQFDGFVSLSAGYSFSHLPCLPFFLRGACMHADWRGEAGSLSDGIAGFRFTKSLWRRGQVSWQLSYNLSANLVNFRTAVSVDLKPVRLVNRFSDYCGSKLLRQNLSGSVSFDNESRKLITSNRSEAGRSAVSVLMFLDSNENGSFDESENIIPAKAIRLDQIARYQLGEDGILRISRLSAYRRYRAEVIREALPDPLLAPAVTKFSFITDPNSFKRIEIPLYVTGVLEGKVLLCKEKENYCRGGIRLLIKSTDNEFEKTIKTFSDGTFYCMSLLPGNYTLKVDPVQLNFLNAESSQLCYNFTITKASGEPVKRKIIINVDKIFK